MILGKDGREKKKRMLFTSKGSVRIAKNWDIGLEKAALGPRPGAAISRPWSQFFPIRTSQLANKIYFLLGADHCEYLYSRGMDSFGMAILKELVYF